jgi:hypothetical protein
MSTLRPDTARPDTARPDTARLDTARLDTVRLDTVRLDRWVAPKELMARLGHSSTRAAMIYQHASEERERRIADRLSQMVAEEAASSVPSERNGARMGHVPPDSPVPHPPLDRKKGP